MKNNINALLDFLPSKNGFEKDIPALNADSLGIHPCGDQEKGYDIYKLLTKEGTMITYLLINGILKYQYTQALHY